MRRLTGEDRVTMGRVRPTGVGRVTLGRVREAIAWNEVTLPSTIWRPAGLMAETPWCREDMSDVVWTQEVIG